MLAFWIAVVLAVIISVAFIAEAVAEFLYLRGSGPAAEPDEWVEADTAAAFSAKAAGGVVASFGCIVAISLTPSLWVLLPVLSLGSAVAVVLAFRIDRRSRRTAASGPGNRG